MIANGLIIMFLLTSVSPETVDVLLEQSIYSVIQGYLLTTVPVSLLVRLSNHVLFSTPSFDL
jgi:hypothetical protein